MRLELTASEDLLHVAEEELGTRGWSIVSDEAKRQTEFWYDTPGFAMLRWGATLVRIDDAEWRLRVPARAGAQPRVLELAEATTRPPSDIADAVRPLVRSWEPQRVLTTELTSRCLGLAYRDQTSLVTLSREDRCVLDGPGVGRTLAIWVLEGDDQEACQLVEERLRAHGAQDGLVPVARFLGQAAQAPADVSIPPIRRNASAGSVLQKALARDVQELLFRLVGVPLEVDPEDVHRARVVTRRMRGLFRTFGKVLELESRTALVDELAWLADQLGPVRDADVMLQRLERTSSMLSVEDQPAVQAIVARLIDERHGRWAELMISLRLHRCVTLLDGLVALASEGLPLAARAGDPAALVLAGHARKRWRRLKRRVKQMPPDPSEADLHRFRIAAKRTRYGCETAALAVGEPATLLAEKVAALQDVLGAHQDAVVLRDWLRQVARDSHDVALAAAELAGIEAARVGATAAGWRDRWEAVDRKGLRRWMRA